jgi:hypothetical protein
MEKLTAIGAYAYSLLPSVEKLNGQFWSTLIGAVVGAVVGGLITLGLQLWNLRHIQNQEAAARERHDFTTATSMLLKAAKMFSTIKHINDHLQAAVEQAKQYEGKDDSIWQMVQSTVGKTSEVAFTDDERMLAVADIPKNFIAVPQMPDIHNSLIDLVAEYSKRRVELMSLISAIPGEGMQATTELTVEEHERLMPRMLNLESLLALMIKQAAEAHTDAIKAFNLIQAVGVRRFGAVFPNLALGVQQGQ